jgi:SAM-dependent methyltransferase
VVGLDLTPEMIAQVVGRGRVEPPGGLIRADASRLPFLDNSCDALFAAGLLHHLDDPIAGLREFARVCRSGARLALFHPIGRVALAARHGSVPDRDDVRGSERINAALDATGWRADLVDDAVERYLVVAIRQ